MINSYSFNFKEWDHLLIDVSQEKGKKEKAQSAYLALSSEKMIQMKVVKLDTREEELLQLTDIQTISKQFFEVVSDEQNKKSFGLGLKKLDETINQMIDTHRLRGTEYISDIFDFLDEMRGIQEKIEETPESIVKKQLVKITEKEINSKGIRRVIELVKDDKNLLFNLLGDGQSFFEFAQVKCQRKDLLPLVIEVFKNLESLDKDALFSFMAFIFKKDEKSSFFELMMKSKQANKLFDSFLKYLRKEDNFTDKFNALKGEYRSQILDFAYSPRRYKYIFFKSRELSKQVLKKADQFFNETSTKISERGILGLASKHPKFETWLKARGTNSSTVREDNRSLLLWKEAEKIRKSYLEKTKTDEQPSLTTLLKQLHSKLCKDELGITHPGEFRKDKDPTPITQGIGGGYLFCPTGKALEKNIEVLDKWWKKEMKKCEKGEKNPIVFAAQAYQRCVSLHLFENGNGRVSRLVMDHVLEKFHLLPPILSDVLDGIFPLHLKKNHDEFVIKIIEGIEKSYSLLTSAK